MQKQQSVNWQEFGNNDYAPANLHPARQPLIEKLRKHKKPLIITSAVVLLQFAFGWDAKFCIINIIWLLI